MDIIKDGKVGNPEEWTSEVVCEKRNDSDKDGCDAVMSISANDLVMMHYFGTHFRHDYPAVRCPQCGKYLWVDVPDLVWEKFNSRENRAKSIFNGEDDSL